MIVLTFLETILQKLGFMERWISLIMSCVSSTKYMIIHGRYVLGPLTPTRAANGAPRVSHMLLADDNYLYCKATVEEAIKIQELLQKFEMASGCLASTMNRNKTTVLGYLKTKVRKHLLSWESRDIEKLMTMFWWQSKGDRKGIIGCLGTNYSARNDLIWNVKEVKFQNIIVFAKTYLDNWKKAQKSDMDASQVELQLGDGKEHWTLPKENSIKINVNAALFEGGHSYDLGLVARDAKCILIEGCTIFSHGKVEPTLAKAIGVREALSWVKVLNVQQMKVETDFLCVVQALHSPLSMAGVTLASGKSIDLRARPWIPWLDPTQTPKMSKTMWFRGPFPIRCDNIPGDSFLEFVENLMLAVSTVDRIPLLCFMRCLCQEIWNLRNKIIFKGSAIDMALLNNQILSKWIEISEVSHSSISSLEVKVDLRSGYWAYMMQKSVATSPLEAEVKAIHMALSWVVQSRISSEIAEIFQGEGISPAVLIVFSV
uniref:RNase H type-1 domain-containing protein n=1 Tax=Cannabis sativa TaxID=3483 RepID=A0A803P1Q1_CANSA